MLRSQKVVDLQRMIVLMLLLLFVVLLGQVYSSLFIGSISECRGESLVALRVVVSLPLSEPPLFRTLFSLPSSRCSIDERLLWRNHGG